jgi:hypothetical protein
MCKRVGSRPLRYSGWDKVSDKGSDDDCRNRGNVYDDVGLKHCAARPHLGLIGLVIHVLIESGALKLIGFG